MTHRLLNADIPPAVLEVVDGLKKAGHRAFLVGGCVRDMLREQQPKDFDVATSATPASVQAAFKRVIPTGIEHGTVTVVVKGVHVEVTTFRAEAEYVDGRRPSKVEFHEDIDADLSRRDFTINAMAWDPLSRELVDPFGGQEDLRARVVRCVRSAIERFSEDGLRPLRAVRFATVLDFTLEPETEAAIPKTLSVFRKVAAERMHQELVKLLMAPKAAMGLALLKRTGLMAAFFAEALEADFEAVGRAPPDEVIRLAILLLGHPEARDVALRVRFPTRTAEEAAALVAHRTLPPDEATDADLRRWMARVEPRRVEALLELNQALRRDCSVLRGRVRALLATKPPLATKDLALDGKGVMAALGVGPSRVIGDATRFLLELVLEDPALNSREALTSALHRWKPPT